MKPVHRLCSVSAETVSNAPNTSSAETTRRGLSASDSRITRRTSEGVSYNPLPAQSSPVDTPKSRDVIAYHVSNRGDIFASSAVVNNDGERHPFSPTNRAKKATYGERLRRLSIQGNRDGNGEVGSNYKTRSEFFQADRSKSGIIYPTEAVEHRHQRGVIPKNNSSLASPEPPDKNSRATSGTRAAVEKAALLYSGNEKIPDEAEQATVSNKTAQSVIANSKAQTNVAHFSETKEAKDDTLRHETRRTLLENVEKTWAVQNKSNAPAVTDGVSPKIPLPQPETLQQYAKRVILPQIHVERMPLSETLKVISDVIKTHTTNERTVNFILADPKKTAPEVDLDIRDVSLERVLHYLSEMTQFTVLYEGNTVIFRDPSLKQSLRTCVFPISRGSVLQILSYTDLHNSDEEKKLSEEERLKQFFQRIGIPMNDKNVGFAYDGSNLIVTHEELWLQRIEAILQEYRQCKQIAIEAKFLEVSQGALDELSLRFNSGRQDGARVAVNMSGGGIRSLSTLESGQKDTTTWTLPGGLDYGGSFGALVNASPVLNRCQMSVLLCAIEQRSDSDLMCTPKVTVLSGRKAEIVVADEFRYPQSYRDGIANVGNDGRGSTAAGVAILGGAPENFTTRNIGIEMTVTPVAEHNGCIHLTLEPRVTQLSGFIDYGGPNIISSGSGTQNFTSGFKQPTFSTRKIKTELSIESGSTVVMGGLTREEVKEMHDRIPLFGDIPIFGKLFQSNGKTSQKKNLLIFVTANLVDENGQYIVEPEFKVAKSL